ncbi:thiol-disulfide oxidoreductase DCC family protein [Psychroflexus sp. MBR-150]|jgi:predicted DCC family thiol-disulfide oxidoreductase YuxK
MNKDPELPKGKHIVLFDGVCNFCNNSVRFIIKHDKKDLYRFASLQSQLGQSLTKSRGIDTQKIDSIILIQPGEAYYIKSNAALEIAKNLNSFYPILSVFVYLPRGFRDFFYDFIAHNRYKWFGKKETCPMPKPEEQDKFLEV